MEKLFFAFAFFLLCAVAGSQDTVVVYLDDKFARSTEEHATYRREAVVVNNLIVVTDKKVDGTMVNYCEFKSLNPRMEHGKAVHYFENGNVYSTGNYRFGQLSGQWIYYSQDGLADTVYYENYNGKEDEEIKSEAIDFYYANQRTKEASEGLKDSINAFIKAGFHLPGRAILEDKKSVTISFSFIVDTDGSLKCPEITRSAHPDIDREIVRLLRLFHYGWDGKKPVKISEMTFSFNCTPADESSEYSVVLAEEMPQFPGGDRGLMKFISENLRYPEDARKMNIQGKVLVRFVVTKTGSVENIEIVRSVDPLLDAECIRLVRMLPPFVPGKSDGKPVNVWYTLPIIFSLK